MDIEKKKSNKLVIILLVLIIIVLAVLCILFATGTINLKTNTTDKEANTKEQIKDNTDNQDEKMSDEEILQNNNIYSAVLEEYKTAIKNNKSEGFNYVNENGMNHYINQKGTDYEIDFSYSFYDINKDGNYEMLINNSIIDVFSYDGSNIIRLFKSNSDCLAEGRCQLVLYDDGTISLAGSTGATGRIISFYNINKSSSTLNTLNSYYEKFDDNGNVTIYDENTYDYNNDTGTKVNYSSEKELIKENIHNTSEFDISKLKWYKIN